MRHVRRLHSDAGKSSFAMQSNARRFLYPSSRDQRTEAKLPYQSAHLATKTCALQSRPGFHPPSPDHPARKLSVPSPLLARHQTVPCGRLLLQLCLAPRESATASDSSRCSSATHPRSLSSDATQLANQDRSTCNCDLLRATAPANCPRNNCLAQQSRRSSSL